MIESAAFVEYNALVDMSVFRKLIVILMPWLG